MAALVVSSLEADEFELYYHSFRCSLQCWQPYLPPHQTFVSVEEVPLYIYPPVGEVAAATAGGVQVMLQYREEKQHFREQFTKERSFFLHICQ